MRVITQISQIRREFFYGLLLVLSPEDGEFPLIHINSEERPGANTSKFLCPIYCLNPTKMLKGGEHKYGS